MAEELPEMRVRPDFYYKPQDWVAISVAPGYSGFALLMPGRSKGSTVVLKLVAEVHSKSRDVAMTYRPEGDGLQIVDLRTKPSDTPGQIIQYFNEHPDKGLNPKPPIVKVEIER